MLTIKCEYNFFHFFGDFDCCALLYCNIKLGIS